MTRPVAEQAEAIDTTSPAGRGPLFSPFPEDHQNIVQADRTSGVRGDFYQETAQALPDPFFLTGSSYRSYSSSLLDWEKLLAPDEGVCRADDLTAASAVGTPAVRRKDKISLFPDIDGLTIEDVDQMRQISRVALRGADVPLINVDARGVYHSELAKNLKLHELVTEVADLNENDAVERLYTAAKQDQFVHNHLKAGMKDLGMASSTLDHDHLSRQAIRNMFVKAREQNRPLRTVITVHPWYDTRTRMGRYMEYRFLGPKFVGQKYQLGQSLVPRHLATYATHQRGRIGPYKIGQYGLLGALDLYTTTLQLNDPEGMDPYLLTSAGSDTLVKGALIGERYVHWRAGKIEVATSVLEDEQARLLRHSHLDEAAKAHLGEIDRQIHANDQMTKTRLVQKNTFRASGMSLAFVASAARFAYDLQNYMNGGPLNLPMIIDSLNNMSELLQFIYKPIIGLWEARGVQTLKEAINVLQHPNLPTKGTLGFATQFVKFGVFVGGGLGLAASLYYWWQASKTNSERDIFVAKIGMVSSMVYIIGNILNFFPPTAPLGMIMIAASHTMWIYQMYYMHKDVVDEFLIQQFNTVTRSMIHAMAQPLAKAYSESLKREVTAEDFYVLMTSLGIDDRDQQARKWLSERDSFRLIDKASSMIIRWNGRLPITNYGRLQTLKEMCQTVKDLSQATDEPLVVETFVYLMSRTIFTPENFQKYYDSEMALFLRNILDSRDAKFVRRVMEMDESRQRNFLAQYHSLPPAGKEMLRWQLQEAPDPVAVASLKSRLSMPVNGDDLSVSREEWNQFLKDKQLGADDDVAQLLGAMLEIQETAS